MKRMWNSAQGLGGGFWVIALCGISLLNACKKDDFPEQDEENKRVNEWILENMERDYYWNDEIPSEPNMRQDPMDFFESILSPEDRFSWIQESGDELSDNLAGKFQSFGYEVKLYYRRPWDDNDPRIVAWVAYTYDGAPADEAGLQRGMSILEVNGEVLDDQNYNGLLFNTAQPQSLTIGDLDAEGNSSNEQTITVNAAEIQENPVYYHSVIPYAGKKVGYLVYNSFIPEPAGGTTNQYDDVVKQVFQGFKDQGVNELILDLRYNLGGSVASAVKMSGYVMKNYQPDNIFAIYEDNKEELFGLRVSDFYEEGETPPNLGNLNRVYVLISSTTASASELIINGLKPFMEVILIGDASTVGKNVASITIVDDRRVPESERIKYGLQPIVFKIYNSEMKSDFEQGFEPNVEVGENFAPLGNQDESFLKAALQHISGEVTMDARLAEAIRSGSVHGRAMGSSLPRKPGRNGMFVRPGEMPFAK